MRSATLILCAAFATGCASSGQGTEAVDRGGSAATVDMIVINRTTGVVTAFAQWRNGPRVSLGEVRAGATRRFTTAYRGPEVWLSLDVLSAPSIGTTAGPTIFNDTGGPAPGRGNTTFVPIDAFDTFEWEIRQTYPSVDLFYRRLPPQ